MAAVCPKACMMMWRRLSLVALGVSLMGNRLIALQAIVRVMSA